MTVEVYSHTGFSPKSDPVLSELVYAENITANVPRKVYNSLTSNGDLTSISSSLTGDNSLKVSGLIHTDIVHGDIIDLFTDPSSVLSTTASTDYETCAIDLQYGAITFKDCRVVSHSLQALKGFKCVYTGTIVWVGRYVE